MFRMTVYPASLTLLICSALIAADGDPFSRWEDPKQGSQPTAQVVPEAVRNTRPTSNSSVEFFSPQAAQKPPVGNPQAAPAPILKRERLQADVKARQSTGVGNAAFVEDTAQPAIQQTSGDFFESFREEPPAVQPEENPFEEFLGKRPTTPSAPAQTTDAAPKQQPPGFAPDALDFGGDTFAQPAGVQSAADLTEPDGPVMPVGLTGAQTPSVTLQWVHHGEFNLGQECRCDLVLENTGRSTVRNVLAEAVLPSGLQVIRATPAPTTVGGTATWTFGELQAGQKRTVELVVVPSEQGETQVSAFVRFTGGSTSSFVVQQPLLAVKVDGPETVEVGQQVNYTVAVSNPGTGKARNVVIQAAIPEGLEHRQGGSLTIDIGTLNPGELRRARLSVTGVKGGQHRLAVRTVGAGGMQDQTMQTVTVAEPRLNIGLRGPTNRRAGQVTDFELIVINEGRVDSSNVRAKYKVPAGFEFVKADVGGMYNAEERTIDWFVGTLEPDQTRQFHVSLRAITAGQVLHQAGVISEHGKMTMTEHSMVVQGNAELKLALVSSSRQVATGDEVSYEVQVDNVGQSAAENVGLSFEIPPGLELQDIAAPTEYIADNGVVIFRSMPTVAPGKRATFTLKTRCKRAGSHQVRARVASESIEEALIDEETTTVRE